MSNSTYYNGYMDLKKSAFADIYEWDAEILEEEETTLAAQIISEAEEEWLGCGDHYLWEDLGEIIRFYMNGHFHNPINEEVIDCWTKMGCEFEYAGVTDSIEVTYHKNLSNNQNGS